MNYSFEYIDIILLAMIAGFIFLRLRGILGKKTGFEGKIPSQLEKEFQKIKVRPKPINENFDEEAQNDFLKGARIAYETIISDFSDNHYLLYENDFQQFYNQSWRYYETRKDSGIDIECYEVDANITTTGTDGYELCLSNLE